MNEINRLLASNMKSARLLLGYSQLKLAEICELSPSYIGDIETGKKFPSSESFLRIARALKLEPYQLLIDAPDNERWDQIRVITELRDELRKSVSAEIDRVIEKRLRRTRK